MALDRDRGRGLRVLILTPTSYLSTALSLTTGPATIPSWVTVIVDWSHEWFSDQLWPSTKKPQGWAEESLDSRLGSRGPFSEAGSSKTPVGQAKFQGL